MSTTRLVDLHRVAGQSPWLDNLRRAYLTSGELARRIDEGVRGLTSNPTIFQKAIEGSSDYDDQFSRLVRRGGPIVDHYWSLVLDDIDGALDAFAGLYERSDRRDGFVSVEVDPGLADDGRATLEAARLLHQRVGRPNLMVKIPATTASLPAIEEMIAEGRSVNVTLIFGLDQYQRVMEAYLAGLERRVAAGATDLADVASVASFFISRVDTEIDARLEAIGSPQALELRGRAAIAQARLAYQAFLGAFRGPRWDALAARGARVQRPLWASTSTKNPAYPDTRYVDELIGPDTVNTLPDSTLDAFVDHGTIGRTIDRDVEQALADWHALAELGVDLGDVAATLERQGVDAFRRSFDDLIDALTAKASALGAA